MTVKFERCCKNMENITVKSNAEHKFDRNGVKCWKLAEKKKQVTCENCVHKEVRSLPNA